MRIVMKISHLICLLLMAGFAHSQKPEYAVLGIPENLKENANAVIREKRVTVEISSRKSISIKTFIAVTVLNEHGLSKINAYENRNVKSIDAILYDAMGFEVKNFKRKDFKEIALSDGAIITDNKRTFLDFTPTQYPFTIVYESEIADSNTAFIPSWYPIEEGLVGIEKYVFQISCPAELGLRYKEYNLDGWEIKKEETANGIVFKTANITALRDESYSPSGSKFLPHVMFGIERFNLEGVEGEARTWENFSAWSYNNLLSGANELSDATKERIKVLVGDEKDPLKKAAIVYKYMQDKTRYVGIQLGIGGWRPMKAKDVDRLGYGDCKALTNYTRCLLEAVGVPAVYAVVFGNENKLDLEQDFVSMQGNHVILAIPNGSDYVWLECTSQKNPFGFLGDFTDDRLALLVKPSGGALVRTSVYKNNTQLSKGSYALDGGGTIKGSVEIRSKGIQYDNRMHLLAKSNDDRKKFYNDYFGINNLQFEKMNVSQDIESVEFMENISLNADRYGEFRGNRLFFAPNAFNRISNVPQRYRTRKNPFEISRPFSDYDEISIAIPQGYVIETKPENTTISDKFGEYKMEYVVVGPQEIAYKRSFALKDGYYKNEEYENFRKFMEQVAKADSSKIVLVKN